MKVTTPEVIQHRKVRWAAALQLTQGLLMEGLPFIGVLLLWCLGLSLDTYLPQKIFIIPVFNEHLPLLMLLSGVFAGLRVVASVGLLRNRQWGYALSTTMCVITLILMIFMLPAGLADGLLSGTALVLLFMTKYGAAQIVPGSHTQ